MLIHYERLLTLAIWISLADIVDICWLILDVNCRDLLFPTLIVNYLWSLWEANKQELSSDISVIRPPFNKKEEFCLMSWQEEAVFCCTFFKANRWDESFRVREDCQRNLFTDSFVRDFVFAGECVSTPRAVFLTQPFMFCPYVNTFWLKHISPYTSLILLQFSHRLHFSAANNFMTDLCSSLNHSNWFATGLNSLKINISARLK